MRKTYARLVMAVVLAVSVATVAMADDLVKYYGMIKGVDDQKSEVIIAPEHAKEKGLPRRMNIRLNKEDFERVKGAYITNKTSPKPDVLMGLARCKDADGEHVAHSFTIIPIGC